MEKIVIPVFENRISPRLDYAESFLIAEIEGRKLINKETIKLLTKNRLQKLNTLIELKPDLIICDGLTDVYGEKLKKKNVRVLSWIHGNANEILDKYIYRRKIKNKLKKRL
ncbi:MAG: hypothetical protein GXO87_03795 [Chlorobi bacterium]|nr:hypothetical protein [Chlorobiota bacterium]